MSEGPHVHVIAEAGSNHCGSLQIARRLVDLAVSAGADSFKLQVIDPDELYLPGTYEFGHYDIEQVREMRRRFMMTDEEYRDVTAYCAERGIPFSASVFDLAGLDLVAAMKPPYIKVASTDLNNIRFLRSVAEKGLPVILSTGMSTLGEIEKSVSAITRGGFADLVLMHCVSVYPATLAEMNLTFMAALGSAFGFPVALSDHTRGSLAAAMAVAMGAVFIEKHFTLDHTMEGFDHAHASEGQDFVQYVADIRHAERAMMPARLKVSDRELYTRKRARRSLYAARDLAAGATIAAADVLVVRPENVMAADLIDEVVGRQLAQPLARYTPFTPEILR